MEAFSPVLAQYGLAGVVIAALGWAYWRRTGDLQAELREVQAARVEDSKKMVQTLLDLVDKQHAALEELSEVFRSGPRR